MINWNADQCALRAGLTEWYDALSADHVEQDARGVFPWDKWKIIQESGILRLPFEESVSTHLVSTGIPVQTFGSADLKTRYLPAICTGDSIGAHTITEPGGGSDALAMHTRARRDGDHYVLDGSKTFVTNGAVADLFVVYAKTHPDAGPLSLTPFLVERGTPGVEIGKPIAKMGLGTSPLTELFFHECRVPVGNVIGRPGGGFIVLDHVMKWEILCSFVINIGEMEHRLERCINYVRARGRFGAPIGSFQAISHKIADMKVGVWVTRKCLFDTAEAVTENRNVTIDLAIAKLVAREHNLTSAAAAVQIFGGNGYMAEYGLEKICGTPSPEPSTPVPRRSNTTGSLQCSACEAGREQQP